jgi:glycine dehydrogenase subunit 1
MLETLGLKSLDDLYAQFPNSLFAKELDIPEAVGEIDIQRKFDYYASKNKIYKTMFRGAGAYAHYIPAIVPEMAYKERFRTNYTPYQAEVSQGTLQAIFEFQTMITQLTGMDVANASIYDVGSAAAEAVAMTRDTRKKKLHALVSGGVDPKILKTIQTYNWAYNASTETLKQDANYSFDIEAFKAYDNPDLCSIVIQQPNFYGVIEDVKAITEVATEKGIKVIAVVNPIASVALESMGACNVDIAVGEGQPLGLPLGFGGPYLGFMACKMKMARNIPGRIVGQTVDEDGKRSYVLTMQAREQHIRRETASSNVCSNQALCALAGSVYMASMGPQGMRDVANLCYSKAHYLADQLKTIGFNLVYNNDFFHEFVTDCPIDIDKLNKQLEDNDILGGLALEDNKILWCATELNTKEQIDNLILLIKEVL